MVDSNRSSANPQESQSLNQKVKTLDRAQSRDDFTQFESIVNMPRGSQLPKRVPTQDPDTRSFNDDDGDGIGSCLAAILQTPVLIASAIIIPIFGLTFIICGSIFYFECKVEPMIPIWLIVQGVILLCGIGVGGMAKKKSTSNILVKIFSLIMFIFTLAWFIAGNVFIYQAWAKEPDYTHFWYNEGCNPALFKLALVCIIVLDCLFPLIIIVGIIAYCLRGCKRR